MSKSLIWALFLITLCALFFIFTNGSTRIEIFRFSFSMRTPIALLLFTGIGTTIGVLLK
jgi:hypothetical protein